jgi:hypothetical protein
MGNKVFGTVKFGKTQLGIAGKWADLMELRGTTDRDGLSCQVKAQEGVLNGSCSGKLGGKSGRANFNIKGSAR